MQRVPSDFTPGLVTIYNGRPAWAKDALEVDRTTTWLAAARKWAIPIPIGAPLTSALTLPAIHLWIPAYTEYVQAEYYCTGLGSMTLTNATDAFNAVTNIYSYDGGAHGLANALWTAGGGPLVAVAANGLDRALSVTFQSSPRVARFTFAVADDGAKTLRVWSLRLRPLPVSDDATALVA